MIAELSFGADLSLEPLFTVAKGYGGYFQNVKGIVKYSPEQIILSLKKGETRVFGQELSVVKYAEGDVLVRGKINEILFEP